MIVGIHVEAQQVKDGVIRHTNSCYFTMVAKDESDVPKEVPKLILETREDVRRFLEAMRMKEIKNKVRDELNDAKSAIRIDEATQLLKGERCIIALNA
jgi:acyl-CoA hydrolase